MAVTISVACPKCKKGFKVPDTVQGKKIKCKDCGNVFPVAAPGKPGGKAAPAAKAGAKDEEWGVITAYGMTKDKDAPRCPFCANDLEDEEQIVCLHCGYNLLTRERLGFQALEPLTPADWLMWQGPAVLCLLVALAFGGLIAIFWIGSPSLDPVYLGWVQEWEMARVYGSLVCAAAIWFAGYFAIKRLVFHPRPPEREKRLGKEGNE
jgi:DNA-directed RNA polymerase subunit RPC12/RpoP